MKNKLVAIPILISLITGCCIFCIVFFKNSFATTSSIDSSVSAGQAEISGFRNDLDLSRIDHVRVLSTRDNTPDITFRFVTGQMGPGYFLKRNQDKATPEAMEAFFAKTKVTANFMAGPNDEYTEAILSGNPDPALIEVAIRHGLYYKRVPNTQGKSLLYLAVEKHNEYLVRTLAEKHPELLSQQDDAGKTPLDVARKQHDKVLIDILTKSAK